MTVYTNTETVQECNYRALQFFFSSAIDRAPEGVLQKRIHPGLEFLDRPKAIFTEMISADAVHRRLAARSMELLTVQLTLEQNFEQHSSHICRILFEP